MARSQNRFRRRAVFLLTVLVLLLTFWFVLPRFEKTSYESAAPVSEPPLSNVDQPLESSSMIEAAEGPAPIAEETSARAPGGRRVGTEVFGRVVLVGNRPRERVIEAARNGSPCGVGPLRTRDYVLSPDGGLADVFVYVKSGLEGRQFRPPDSVVEVMATNCFLSPYVFGVQVDQRVWIQNSRRHHPFRVLSSSGQEFAWPSAGDDRAEGGLELVFSGPDQFHRITCALHPWVWGYAAVVSHPFFAVTGVDGKFRLPLGLRPGSYLIAAHHPVAGEVLQSVVVIRGENELLFEIPAVVPETPTTLPIRAAASNPVEEIPELPDSASEFDVSAGRGLREPGGIAPVGNVPGPRVITGRVTLAGTPPPERVIDALSNDPQCGRIQSDPVFTRFYVVGESAELADVVVTLEGPELAGRATGSEATPLLIDQVRCLYVPQVSAVQTGQKILVRNSDPFMHNVHPVPVVAGNREANKAQMPRAPDLVFSFDRPEAFLKFKCDVHPWMFAYVTVMDHPYFAVTGTDGRFAISNAPPGRFVIVAHHRKAGRISQPVELTEGTTEVELVLTAK